jgi:hypothetical protein
MDRSLRRRRVLRGQADHRDKDVERPPQRRRRHRLSAEFRPPEGKLIKIVAVARSDEHIFYLGGGRATKSGQAVSAAGGYSLNPSGQPHSAMIATETISFVLYTGEPDEVKSVEVLDIAGASGERP